MAKRRKVSNLLALSLLTLLTERPMYPYEMASMLRARGKDNAIKINWGSFYTVVQNLEKYGFIEAVEVAREGQAAGADHLPGHRRGPCGAGWTGCANCSACRNGSTAASRRPSARPPSCRPTS